MIRVGIIGLGAMGRLHFQSWKTCPGAQIGAISARDPKLRAGDWGGKEFNLGDQSAERVDLSGIAPYERAEDLVADPAIDAVDICTATPQHAPLAIAALRAGKHVLCEKPMALSLEECDAMQAAADESGKVLMIAHCLRFWPHYLKAASIIKSGEFGRPLYARLERTGAAPKWSSGGWLMKAGESGGVLDMHIHDVDVALWWFGRPVGMEVSGAAPGGLPMIIDAQWRYENDLSVHLHGAWDPNGGNFRHAFRVVLEKATIAHDLARDPNVLEIWKDGEMEKVEIGDGGIGYSAEIEAFASAVKSGAPAAQCLSSDSRASVELGLRELDLLSRGK
ncbi:MAG: Gfo/Idh/MocA family protein [Chthoniobacteraceae bacterium]